MNWKWILIGFIILAMLFSSVLTKPVQVGVKTIALLLDLGVGYKGKTQAVPRGITISEVSYPCGGRTVVASLYRPDDKKRHSGIILAHGAVKDGKDDPALKLAGKSLARAGYVVLIPQLENLGRFRLHPDDIQTLVASFQYLSRQAFSNNKIGMMGVCLSAPLAFLAATEPSISQGVAVIAWWGGYYDIKDWVQAVLTEHCTYRGKIKPWQPRPTLAEEIPKWLVGLLHSSSDRAHIEEMLKGKPTASNKGNLSLAGQAMYELLVNRDPGRVDDLWARLGPEIQRTLASLSPHLRAEQLHTKIAILHTFVDDAVPSVESLKLADAIKDENKIYFRVFHQFTHVRLEELLKLRMSNLCNTISEAAQFCLYIYHVLYQL